MNELRPIHSVSVAGVVIHPDGKVLSIQRADNELWAPPGGVLERDETFEQGVVREILEETGVLVTAERLTGVYKNFNLGVVALVYRCHPVSGEPHPTEEARAVEWLTVEEACARMLPAFAIRVTDALGDMVASRAHDGVDLI
ncbi:NUDIX domain-containing protein [Actinomycetes bacterium KLBMP 9759]